MPKARAPRAAPDSDAEDVRLLRRIARKDVEAFEAFYRRFGNRVGGYLWKLLRSHELVDETLDDVMWVIWQKADSFDGRSRVSAWLFGIARNKAMKALDRSRRERAVSVGDVAEVSDRDHVNRETLDTASGEWLEHRDALRALAAALQTLSVEHRSVLELTFFEGLSYREIAKIHECPVGTIKTRVFHARRALTSKMAGHLVD